MTQEYWYRNKSNQQDGLHSYCKECSKKAAYDSFLKNKELSNARNREWYTKNREVVLEKKLTYNQENKIRMQKVQKKWRQENKEKISEYNQYRRMNKAHDITDKEKKLCKDYFSNSCAYCGLSEEEHYRIHNQQLHMDHVDPNGANDLSNNIPACKVCNVKKRDRDVQEFFEKYGVPKEYQQNIQNWLNGDYLEYIDLNEGV